MENKLIEYVIKLFEMNNLPLELHQLICYFCNYKSNIMIKATSKYFYKNINSENILYETHNEKILLNDIYLKYNKKKKFILSNDEHIIYQKINKLCDGLFGP